VIRRVRKAAGVLFIDWRTWTETALAGALIVAYFLSTNAHGFETSMGKDARAALYGSLAGTSAALLGFVLAALAVLVALPGSDRIKALRTHPNWPRVPSAYVRASLALLTSVVVCTLGIVLDGGERARQPYEALAVVIVAFAFALVRVLGSVVALDQILSVAGSAGPAASPAIIDP
jgi:hypothetical protein